MWNAAGRCAHLAVISAPLSALLSLGNVAAHESAHSGKQSISVRYDIPKEQAHREIYETMRQRRVLEQVAAALGLVRLPKRLTYRLKECSGEPNAWYDPRTRTVTVCYELVSSILRLAPATTSPAGVSRNDAVRGPVLQILLHESSHALFDLLRTPVLGREEDAADQVASLVLLHLAPADARAVVNGSAYFFATLGKHEPIDRGSFADAHGLTWQRFYNLACLAYGSDRRRYGYIVEKGYLPTERARACEEEYNQIDFAFQALIVPHLRVSPRHGARLRRAISNVLRTHKGDRMVLGIGVAPAAWHPPPVVACWQDALD
ncbi:DUF4344 domain-containing metallopeptidase [Methylobacterium nigriterrae]|uniref:DUF4344 domain-containing metallopeptidase n=1 Tax=Methylobacterium nigriterrae TaxID=3127512 RepID=UPI003013612B